MRKIILIVTLFVLCFVITLVGLYSFYIKSVSNVKKNVIVTIDKGMTNRDIGNVLETNGLIKSKDFFVIYLKINNVNGLKAGTYKLSPNMNLKDIVSNLKDGNIYTDDTIRITFKEGINFRGIARVIEKNTNNSYDDVLNILNNKDYLKSLIEDYWFITDDILNQEIYYPLEGYLFPDTYEFKNKDVTVEEIFKKLLDQMNIVLEPYKTIVESDKYSIHELLTLASIAEKEVTNTTNNPDNRKKVISVFINRLNRNMSLGSDVTTRYGIKLDDDRPLTKSEYATINSYNTRNVNMKKMPVSPICMVSKDSIEASINRIDTNYLYFIANIKTSETFFFETSREFEAKKSELSKVNGGY